MVGSGSGTWSGQFDRIRIRPKGSDPRGSGSATLVFCSSSIIGRIFGLFITRYRYAAGHIRYLAGCRCLPPFFSLIWPFVWTLLCGNCDLSNLMYTVHRRLICCTPSTRPRWPLPWATTTPTSCASSETTWRLRPCSQSSGKKFRIFGIPHKQRCGFKYSEFGSGSWVMAQFGFRIQGYLYYQFWEVKNFNRFRGNNFLLSLRK